MIFSADFRLVIFRDGQNHRPSMAALVVTEKHLWVNLSKGINLISPFDVNTVVERFQKAMKHTAVFQHFLPHWVQVLAAAGWAQQFPASSVPSVRLETLQQCEARTLWGNDQSNQFGCTLPVICFRALSFTQNTPEACLKRLVLLEHLAA